MHQSSPIYLAGKARAGATEQENRAVHAMARLLLHGRIDNIQTSWVKLGDHGTGLMLTGGANDVGGTLMEETISRMAGAENGSLKTINQLRELAHGIGRPARQRSTTYGEVSPERLRAAQCFDEVLGRAAPARRHESLSLKKEHHVSTIAIIGGTGPQGRGLGYRFAKGGHDVVLGSRSEERAKEAAFDLQGRISGYGSIRGATNAKSTTVADMVLLAVPYAGHDELVAELAAELAGKIVISCINPLAFDKAGPYGLDLGPASAAENAQALLPDSAVIGAFHHLSAVSLISEADMLDHEDVLVCGDNTEAKAHVLELASTVTGKQGIDAGALRMARQLRATDRRPHLDQQALQDPRRDRTCGHGRLRWRPGPPSCRSRTHVTQNVDWVETPPNGATSR